MSKSIFDFPAPKQKEAKGILQQTTNLPSQSGNGEIDAPSRQGNIGNCGLLSAISSIAATDTGKKAISDAINIINDPNDKPLYYLINFKGKDNSAIISRDEIKKAQEIMYIEKNDSIETSSFKRRYSVGDDDMTALELAMEKCFKTSDDPMLKKLVNMRPHTNHDLMDNVNPSCVSYLLTGELAQEYRVLDDINTGEEETQYRAENKSLGQYVFDELSDSKSENMVVFGNDFDTDIKDINGEEITIFGNHAYAVTDVQEDVLTLVNPWDTSESIEINKDDLSEFEGYTIFKAELAQDEY